MWAFIPLKNNNINYICMYQQSLFSLRSDVLQVLNGKLAKHILQIILIMLLYMQNNAILSNYF